MTDDDIDELPHPPRRWPPFTVVAAAALLILPPLAWCVLAAVYDHWYMATPPLIWLLISARPVWQLLRGIESGYGGAIGLLLLVAVVLATQGVLTVSNGIDPVAVLLAALPVVGWLLCVAAFLYWPATRVWCGRLAPDPYAEDDD